MRRAERTRAGGTWTESRFWSFLRSNLRLAWRKWPPRAQALKAARRPYMGESKRQKWWYVCAACNHYFKGTDVEVDHIIPCGSMKSWDDLRGFVQRMFCEADGLQILCKPCHKAKRGK